MPPVGFSNNNKSASANAGFVAEAISELLLTNRIFETDALPHNVNPLSVSVQSSRKKSSILNYICGLLTGTRGSRELSLRS